MAKAAKSTPKKKSSGPSNLVIVESPAKAKTINKFLGKDFQVEASMGHVRDLPKSKMGIDIEHDFAPQYVIVAKSRKTVSNLKKQAKGKSCIYLAPDPDREGEAISWHLEQIFKEADDSIPIQRVVFNEITKEAVTKAFEKTRPIAMHLVDAQQARRVLDRVVGYELSPLLWKKVGRGLSAGRVQSVALRLIVEREREIRKFVPVEYWSLEAKLAPHDPDRASQAFIAKLEKIGEEKADLKNKEQAQKIREEILKLPFTVNKLEKKTRKKYPQAPYTTSKLQQEAYNRLGFSASKTMTLAQRLYEGVELGPEGSIGLITYMRTDSVNIAASAKEEAASYIKQKYGTDHLPETPPVYKSKKGAQEAHEAIRPSSVLREPNAIKEYLEEDAYKLYALIWKKFVSSQMAAAIDEHVSLWTAAGDKYFFKTTGRRNVFPGFTAVFEEPKAAVKAPGETGDDAPDEGGVEQNDLPDLKDGEPLALRELIGYQHFTKPPGRYNDASLVKMLEEKGIGRPSTYAPTIQTIVSRDYVTRKGGALVPSELGETVTDLLVQFFPHVLEVEFTARMEEELDKIEDGEVEWVKVLKEFYKPFEENMKTAREQMESIRVEPSPTEYVCDVCAKPMLLKMGRFGKFLACSGFPECKYTRSLPTGFLCPQPGCGGELIKRMSRMRRTFYGCSKYPNCNYIANKLPKKEDEEGAEKSQVQRLETLGP